jgi:hypothetical protein
MHNSIVFILYISLVFISYIFNFFLIIFTTIRFFFLSYVNCERLTFLLLLLINNNKKFVRKLNHILFLSFSYAQANMNEIVILFIIGILLPSAFSTYNITHLQNGFLFEKLDTIYIQSSAWIFVSNINLTAYYEEIEYAKNIINETKHQCTLLTKFEDENELCSGIILQLEEELMEITNNNKFFLPLTNDFKRAKRGLLNIGGRGMKILFGTPSDLDAEKYTSQIDQLEKTTSNMERHIDVHTTLLHSVLTKLNSSSNIINKHTAMINEITAEVDVLNRSFKKENIYSRIHYLFDELAEYILLLLTKINRDQSKLLDITSAAKNGILHSSLFDPDSMYEEMVSAQITLRGVHFPYHLKKSNMYRILDLSTFNAYIYNNIILFKIITPLIREETFDIYNTISIPMRIDNNKYEIIQPEFRTFIIDRKHKTYAPFKESDANLQQNCKKLDEQLFLCKLHSPMFLVHARKNCEIGMFTTSTLDFSVCTKEEYALKEQLWIWLRTPNSYILLSPTPMSISFNCNDTNKAERISTFVYINTDCDIMSNDVIIPSITTYQSIVHANIRHVIFLPELNATRINSKPKIFHSSETIQKIQPIETNMLETINKHKADKTNIPILVIIIITSVIILAVTLLYIFAFWLYTRGVKATNQTNNIEE